MKFVVFLAGAYVCLLLAIGAPARRRATLSFALLLASVAVLPVYVPGPTTHVAQVGIAPPDIVVTSYLIAVVLGLALTAHGSSNFRSFLVAAAYLALGLWIWWDADPERVSGSVAILTVMLASMLGARLASRLIVESKAVHHVTVMVVLLLVAEAAVAALQYAGIDPSVGGMPLFATSEMTSELTSGRAAGTTDHPGSLGRLVFFLVLLLLPPSIAPKAATRNWANAGIAVSLIPLALSQGRANFFAVLTLLAMWTVLAPARLGVPKRFALVIVGTVGAALTAPLLVRRFELDPEGGARDHLTQVALQHIPKSLWFGVGPNSYVKEFGHYDRLTGEGWPVHNVYLLLTAELGLVGMIILATLLLRRLFTAIVVAWRDPSNSYARALLASLPGIWLLTTTGWGFLAGPSPVIAALVLSFTWAGALMGSSVHPSEVDSDGGPIRPSTMRAATGPAPTGARSV